jgi:membrane-associated PAP2 superfamily phosphatase
MNSMRLSLHLRNEKVLFSLMAFSIVLIVLNLVTIKSALIGTVASILYFLIGGNFVGIHLLKEEQLLERVSLGSLALLSLMGLMGWAFIIFRGLGIVETAIVLAATFCFVVVVVRFKRANGVKGEGST